MTHRSKYSQFSKTDNPENKMTTRRSMRVQEKIDHLGIASMVLFTPGFPGSDASTKAERKTSSTRPRMRKTTSVRRRRSSHVNELRQNSLIRLSMDKLVEGASEEMNRTEENQSVTTNNGSRRSDFVRTRSRRLPGQKRVTSYSIRRSNQQTDDLTGNGVLKEKLKKLDVVF